MTKEKPGGEVLLYQTAEGDMRLDVRMHGETVWLTQEQMAQLFERDRSVITRHINNVFEEGEVDEKSNVQNLHIAGSDRPTKLYSLDLIISVGYRVNSKRGTQFRIWATQNLKDYMIKGFVLDDRRFKERGADRYFDELLDRIRDIRSSERMFYDKVKDIYATSSDYDPKDELTQAFFAAVQNKLHYAVHGHTAAEIIHSRANPALPNMGVTNYPGSRLLAKDATVAKNYLSEPELKTLGLLVEQYLAFAELQANNRRLMAMRDWAEQLDAILRLNRMDILPGAGRISADLAKQKALSAYDEFSVRRRQDEEALRDAETAEVLAKSAAALAKPGKKPRKPKK